MRPATVLRWNHNAVQGPVTTSVSGRVWAAGDGELAVPSRGHIEVRTLSVAVVGSVIAHALAIAWVAADDRADRIAEVEVTVAPSSTSTSTLRPVPPIDEPVAIVLLDREPATAAHAKDETKRPAPRAPRASSSSVASISATSTGTGEQRGSPAGEPATSTLMTMRERPVIKGMSTTFVDDFLARSKPLPPPPDIPGERIGNEIADLRARIRHAGPDEAAGLRAQLVELNRQREAEELKPAGGGTFKATKPTFVAKVDTDGTVHFKDRNLDSQDKFMLKHGVDPYARNKLAFLDRTRDQRVAVGERYRREQLSRSAELMQRNIDRLFQLATTIRERKEGLFDLWDDCAESGSDDLVAGGTAARDLVLGVIRGRLRGPDAFTPDELARLNARRRSKQPFAP